MEDPKRVVTAGYDAIHAEYAAWGNLGDTLRRDSIDWVIEQSLVRPGARALDLGCGTGALATGYLAQHFHTTGVDISPASITAARSAVPNADFLVGDRATLVLPPGGFDLVTAFYSVIHVPREEHAAVLTRIASWLRPGGIVIITMAAADAHEAVDPDWLGVPMYWSNWDADTNRQLVNEAGFEILRDNIESTVEDGRAVPFLWLVGRI